MVKNLEGGWVCRTAVSDISNRKRAEKEIQELNATLEKRSAGLEKAKLELQSKTDASVEASRLKSQFVANISHEFRTPLNAILGYSRLFLEKAYGDLREEQAFPLARILKNAEELRSLVDQVLDLSKIGAGKLALEIRPVHLSFLVEELVLDMKAAFKKKGLSLTLDVQKDLPCIYSDYHKIKQVLTNLLLNAVKFTHQGGIILRALERKGGEGIDIILSDTGIGIREDQLSEIFGAFHQVDGTETREFGGVGLGLAIVKELTQLLKGQIQVQSEYGKGSTFTLFLPHQI